MDTESPERRFLITCAKLAIAVVVWLGIVLVLVQVLPRAIAMVGGVAVGFLLLFGWALRDTTFDPFRRDRK